MAEGHGNFLSIGKDCLLSDEILFRPSDGHVILDKTTGKLLNKPQGITIGDHVWIGQRAVFFKRRFRRRQFNRRSFFRRYQTF